MERIEIDMGGLHLTGNTGMTIGQRTNNKTTVDEHGSVVTSCEKETGIIFDKPVTQNTGASLPLGPIEAVEVEADDQKVREASKRVLNDLLNQLREKREQDNKSCLEMLKKAASNDPIEKGELGTLINKARSFHTRYEPNLTSGLCILLLARKSGLDEVQYWASRQVCEDYLNKPDAVAYALDLIGYMNDNPTCIQGQEGIAIKYVHCFVYEDKVNRDFSTSIDCELEGFDRSNLDIAKKSSEEDRYTAIKQLITELRSLNYVANKYRIIKELSNLSKYEDEWDRKKYAIHGMLCFTSSGEQSASHLEELDQAIRRAY